MPTIRRYVILESAGAGAIVLARETAGADWVATALTGEDTLHMSELGIEIPLSELYEDVEFAPEPGTMEQSG